MRRIAVHAYQAGAGLVTPFLSDEEITLARYRHGADAGFDRAAGWLYEGMAKAMPMARPAWRSSAMIPCFCRARIRPRSAAPTRRNSLAYQPALEKIAGFDINWNIISYPTLSWARRVFSGEADDVAVAKLADAIFAASRVDRDDPVAAWRDHNAALSARTQWLNGKRFSALHFSGPGTDLTVGLADGHEWHGGASTAKNGITCNPNIPTEEVFTTPHALRVEGRVTSTKPLSHQGTLIENIAVRFEGGRIVEAAATRGADVLNKVLDTDEGARRLGEVALVPHSSPISASGLLFYYNTVRRERRLPHRARPVLFKSASSTARSSRRSRLRRRAATRA